MFSVDNSVWIGSSINAFREFIWVTGEKIGFTAWAPGEPVYQRGSCVQLWKENAFRWDDINCDYSRYFICEKPYTL